MLLRSGKSIKKSEMDLQEQSTSQEQGDQPQQGLTLESFLQKMTEQFQQTKQELGERITESNQQLRQELKLDNQLLNNKIIELKEENQRTKQELKEDIKNIKLDQEQLEERIARGFVVMKEEVLKEFEVEKENINEDIRKIQHDNERLEGKINKEIQNEKGKREELAEVVNTKINYLSGRLREERQEVDEKINEINREFNIRINEARSTSIPNVSIMSDAIPRFYGDRRIHPKIFIQNLEDLLKETGTISNYKYYIRTNFKGEAEKWLTINMNTFENFFDFKTKFLAYFWGEFEQQKVRENLFIGRYNAYFGQTRESYVLEKYHIALQLEPPLTESEIVKYISRHFEDEIRNTIAIQAIDTVNGLINYVKRIDEIVVREKGQKQNYDDKQRDNYHDNKNDQAKRRDNRYNNFNNQNRGSYDNNYQYNYRRNNYNNYNNDRQPYRNENNRQREGYNRDGREQNTQNLNQININKETEEKMVQNQTRFQQNNPRREEDSIQVQIEPPSRIKQNFH